MEIAKRLPDGRIVFVKDGVYFALDKQQREEMKRLLEETDPELNTCTTAGEPTCASPSCETGKKGK